MTSVYKSKPQQSDRCSSRRERLTKILPFEEVNRYIRSSSPDVTDGSITRLRTKTVQFELGNTICTSESQGVEQCPKLIVGIRRAVLLSTSKLRSTDVSSTRTRSGRVSKQPLRWVPSIWTSLVSKTGGRR